MPEFFYRGRNRRGEQISGAIEASSQQAVAAWMAGSGITPIEIGERASGSALDELVRAYLPAPKVRDNDLLLFTRQMISLVKAGVPMMQALAGVQRSTANPTLARILQEVRIDLDRGADLSTSLARHPKVFGDYYVSMVRVGEATGLLDATFERLFAQLQFDMKIRREIRSALRYPTFVLSAVAVGAAILNLYVIPVFARVFSGMNMELPMLTRVLLGVSQFFVDFWWVIAAGGVLATFAIRSALATTETRYQWDRLKLKLPIVGVIVSKATMARLTRSFAVAVKSGVPLMQAFTLVSRVVDNSFFADRLLQMRDGVERGESLLRVAQTSGIFMPLELQMLAIGEETGDVDGMMMQVAEMYQQDVEYNVSRLSSAVEPILITSMAALVMVMMLGIFLPMWDLGQMARTR